MEKTYECYKEHLQKIAHLTSAIMLLSWDQEVYMPKKGAEIRAKQFSTLSTIAHELVTDQKFENLVDYLLAKSSFGFKEKRNLQETKKEIVEGKKLSADFIQRSSLARSAAFQSWQKARADENFAVYVPSLKNMVALETERAGLLGYEKHPYDALLNLYEKGLTVEKLEKVFLQVKNQIVPLVKQISERPQVDNSFLTQKYNKEKQFDFSLELLKYMNFDFDAGRQDLSTHPFSINFNSNDVRVTTRVRENDLSEVIWSTIHEGGHGLYNQGLGGDHFGLPSGEWVSLGIHESQSRIWENNIGRAKHWWKFIYPQLQDVFPEQLKGVLLDNFYKGINKVEPSLIRTSADELTYHIHVMIRYEIEKELFEGTIEVEQLEEVWNEKYTQYLGVTPSKPSEGVLQDVHWSHGSFGYFPTYSIGSFYAAQFYFHAEKEIINLSNQLEKGEVNAFLNLMRKKIHQHGKLYTPEQLSEKFTGEGLNINYFVAYAKEKYASIYELSFE
jgi:carboxypeptidase Taq